MVHTTKVNSNKTKSQDKVTTTGLMARATQEAGARTKWTATECSHGRMARSMRATLSTIREKAKESSYGLMVVCTEVAGRLANSTESESTLVKKESPRKESGRMVAKLDG